MEKIEIRYDKKKLVFGIVILVVMALGTTYITFFTKALAKNEIIKFVMVLIILFIPYALYVQIKKLTANNSVITLTKTYIEINESGKPITFQWTEVTEWKIERKLSASGKSHTDVLLVKSDTNLAKVNLSTLERRTEDIQELISRYKG